MRKAARTTAAQAAQRRDPLLARIAQEHLFIETLQTRKHDCLDFHTTLITRSTTMPAQTTPITERQLDLITRAHCDAHGLIEPLLKLKGGAKLKMIASLAQRGLIEQMDGQWRITGAAIAIIQGEAQPEDVLPPTVATRVATPPLASDPELEAAVAAAEASWQQDQPDVAPKRGREHSKQALVIEMLKRPEGATIAQISEATGWQAHTVRGTFAGALKKKLGLTIVSEKIEGPAGTPGAGQRLYRIAAAATA